MKIMKFLDAFTFLKPKQKRLFPLTAPFEEQAKYLSDSTISYLSGDITPKDMEQTLADSGMMAQSIADLIDFGIDLQIRSLIESGTMTAALSTGKPVFANFEPISDVGFKKSKQNIDDLVKKCILRPDFCQFIRPTHIRGVFAQDRILASLESYRQVNELWLNPTQLASDIFFNQLILTGTTDIIFTDMDLAWAFREMMMISYVLVNSDGEPDWDQFPFSGTKNDHQSSFKKMFETASLDDQELKKQLARQLLVPLESEAQ
ncbi:hypothetical protein OTK49_03530 [Vibrio coralliirubri]|uniref:hypothetical protein n=1 Tax=Vibrio coralliirubri TaxID=1516159 RepID=UPI0022848E19|nr:hypothetical protein [Vibrio coralliirubri]MCY9861589.1 hypothetical protein [Vibrio coralliirubri]